MALRSNFEPGTTKWAVRRSQWLAMGLTEADLEKPKIAIVNSSSALSVCYSHLDDLAKLVAGAVTAAGGLPFEIRTAAPSDFVTSAGKSARYLMPTRDLIVNDIEVVVEGALLDGMICLASCDKTTPGQLMAAGRLNVPTTIVIGGYQLGGICGGKPVDIDDVYESVGAVEAGRLTVSELGDMAAESINGPGVCAGLGTANTMHILSEALGMSIPGSGPVRAGSDRMEELAVSAAIRCVDMISESLTPRDILTPAAFRNAVLVDLAIAGSVNSVRHLQAIAVESGLDLDIYALVEKLGHEVPQLVAVRPNGPHRIEELELAGGATAVMHELSSMLDLEVATVTGWTVGENIAAFVRESSEPCVVHSLDEPVRATSGLALFRGSLAPGGALVKTGALPNGRDSFSGPARVFETEEDAIAAIGSGILHRGDVVVLRGLGPKGGPGTVFAAGFVAALNGAGLAADVACVTDGELSGLNRGITIGQVMPEAAEGGPLALVAENDAITIDLARQTVDLDVDADVLASRRALWRPAPMPTDRSWLSQYRHLVGSLSTGAVLGPIPVDRSVR